MSNNQTDPVIAIVGLGYVGLPLAVELSRHFQVFGFDTDQSRIDELGLGIDRTQEVSSDALRGATHQLTYTNDIATTNAANIYIVTVPTPIDRYRQPDLGPLISASRFVGGVLTQGDLVIFESTVYPGTTEEVCVPAIEESSGLVFGTDFGVGYSPERINPGDTANSLTGIVKITSGSSPEIARKVDSLYATIITAGTYPAPSIKVAEAAKVVENTQRDVNIALMNELAMLFHKLGLETGEVLQAARTKWNFLPFTPGLVGGHCIGVDPYYLAYKAQAVGHDPQLILTSRSINDQMGDHITNRIARLMLKRQINAAEARALILGVTFKENCPDLRNSRVVDIARGLESLGMQVDCHDPWVDSQDAESRYQLSMVSLPLNTKYDVVVVAVAHQQFQNLDQERLNQWTNENCVIFDVKGLLAPNLADERL